jgi:hypothetical protein
LPATKVAPDLSIKYSNEGATSFADIAL